MGANDVEELRLSGPGCGVPSRDLRPDSRYRPPLPLVYDPAIFGSQQSTTFLAFAERLTKGNIAGEDTAQVEKLLVHAFLRDLRRAYSRLPWRLRGWRRTAYPLVTIDGKADATDVRYRFVRLLGDVGNETGRFNPLLVVYSAERPAAETAEPSGPDDAYESWAEALPKARRKRDPFAWVLPLSPPGDVAAGAGVPRITAPKPPFFSRPVFVISVAVVLCASLAAWGVGKSGGLGCLHRPFHGAVSVRQIDGECVGYSDDAAFKFNDEPGQTALRNIQERIFAQNRQVDEDWGRSGRRRPYVTLVYLGTLTGRAVRANEEAYAAEREELEGLAVAQYDGLQEPGSAYGKPLLHVVIANAGFQMRHVGAATDMVADLARRDPTVVGVVGLVESRTDTATALAELNEKGLLAIAPNLSADGLYKNSKLYLQVVPPNRDQARMVAEYARRVLRVSGTHIYYSVGDDATLDSDLYVSTLRQDLISEFGAGHDQLFTPGAPLSQECGYRGMLFFAGRWSDFPNFLDGLKRDCVNDMPVHLVADDSVNRYMANTTIRPDAPGNLALTYISKATLATCDQLQARMATDGTSSRFLRWVQAPKLLGPPRCLGSGGLPVGERVGLAYDSTMMVLQAVEALAARVNGGAVRPWDPHAMSSVAIYTEILRKNSITAFPGVTGAIKFTPQDPGEPVNKRLALVQVKSIPDLTTAPTEVFHCGIGVLDGHASSSASGCTR